MEKDNLIQVIGYRKGFDKKTGKPYTWQQHFKHIQITSIISLFKNIEQIIELIPEHERYDVHYTNANCIKPKEDKTIPLRLFASQSMIPIDLDGIDLNRSEDYIKIVCERLGIDRDKTPITNSGNGLHFAIALTQSIDSGEELNKLQRYYRALCKELDEMFMLAGLSGNADPVRLAESSTLRLPLTINNKDPNNPKVAQLIQRYIEPQPFYLDKIVEPIEEDAETMAALRNVDTESVLSGCDFLKNCLNNPQSVTEPQWYAMLGVLSYIPEIGKNLCHTYSKEHPDYSYEDTETKTDQALGFGKPRTCDSIHGVYPSCVSCPHFKKIRTPLSIKSDEFIETATTGFHNIVYGDTGKPAKYIPNYSDLLKHFSNTYQYVVDKTTREVMVYNGKYWEAYNHSQVDEFATKNFSPQANNTKRNEFKGLMLSTNLVDRDFIESSHSGYINFNNGVLRLSDKTIMPHSADYGFTYVLPYDYNPNAICPNFDAMMENITVKEKDLEQLLLEFMGYAISGSRASFGSKALILTGTGSNGKSTFLDVVKMLIGRSCYSTVSLQDMSNPNARYSMVNKLFNICEEVDEDELRKGTAIFKSITSGAELTVKRLYSDISTMRIDSKLVVACNELPQSKENTHAIYRRMIIAPFRATFSKQTGVDKGILNRISDEMSGVYNRILAAYDVFIKNNWEFTEAVASERALEEYKYNNSTFNQYVQDCLEVGNEEDFLTNTELISIYNQWAIMSNISYRPTTVRLIKELRAMGFIRTDSVTIKRGGQVYRGYTHIKKIGGAF